MSEPMHQYEMRWYATFWNVHNQEIMRVQIGPGKVAIPHAAAYMTVDAELKSSSSGGGI